MIARSVVQLGGFYDDILCSRAMTDASNLITSTVRSFEPDPSSYVLAVTLAGNWAAQSIPRVMPAMKAPQCRFPISRGTEMYLSRMGSLSKIISVVSRGGENHQVSIIKSGRAKKLLRTTQLGRASLARAAPVGCGRGVRDEAAVGAGRAQGPPAAGGPCP